MQGGGPVAQRGDALSFGVFGVEKQLVVAMAESLGRGSTRIR